jgi:N-hydroxyarylamine O-acetyltransferase
MARPPLLQLWSGLEERLDIASYFSRIGYDGAPAADLDTLRQIQRAHLTHIPYENLDVQLGRHVTLDPEDAFAKLVTGGRGGWCYEMNGLFGRMLEAIGFRVTVMTGAVMRAERGASAIGNHLVLAVHLEELYLVDVGLGDGPSEPIPLREGSYRQGWRTLGLERLPDGWWRFHNARHALAPSFDFQHQPADWAVLRQRCHWQQTNPDSRFVQNAICLRHGSNSIVALIGRVLKTMDEQGTTDHLIGSAEEYTETLTAVFGIRLAEAASLWPRISRRHAELFGA